MTGRPQTARLLDRDQAEAAATLAREVGVAVAASRLGLHGNMLRNAWRRYGITWRAGPEPGRARAGRLRAPCSVREALGRPITR